jgi:hypothetical protein
MAAAGFGAVGLGATLAGGILGAVGAQKQGESQQQMYNYKAQVSKINADINRQNAAWARTKGEKEAAQFGMKAAQQRGQIRATQGASNLDVNSGSAKEVQQSQEKIKDIDMSTIRENAAKIAYDYETKAVMDENQAGLDTMSGEYAKEASNIKSIESILGSVSTVSSKWQHGSSIGLWS